MQQLEHIAALTSLRSLMLFDGVTDDMLHIISELPLLVDLYSDTAVLSTTAAEALSQLPSLRYLHLAGATHAGLSVALRKGSPLRRLRALDFRYEHNAEAVTDAYVAAIVDGLPLLFFVDLGGARRPTNATLHTLAALRHLRHVNLADAARVDAHMFDRFAHHLATRGPSSRALSNDERALLFDPSSSERRRRAASAFALAAAAVAAAATSVRQAAATLCV